MKIIEFERPTKFMFFCPGCECNHWFQTKAPIERPNEPEWTYNNDPNNPTINASILVRDGQGLICHSFIENGKIRFLDDCTHKLKNQVIDLPDLEKE